MNKRPLAIVAENVEAPKGSTFYPEPFAKRVSGRTKRKLGDIFGLSNFGVNLTTLEPGTQSALMHRHAVQDEFVYILEGTALLRTDEGEVELTPGMCAGFPAAGIAHHLVNNSDNPVVYLEIGDRLTGDSATYPEDDIVATANPAGGWFFTQKDGTSY